MSQSRRLSVLSCLITLILLLNAAADDDGDDDDDDDDAGCCGRQAEGHARLCGKVTTRSKVFRACALKRS